MVPRVPPDVKDLLAALAPLVCKEKRVPSVPRDALVPLAHRVEMETRDALVLLATLDRLDVLELLDPEV